MKIRAALIIFVVTLFKLYKAAKQHNFKIEYEWKQIEFDFGSEMEREESIKNGTFRPETIQPIDVQLYYNEFGEKIVFITCPRIREGTPVTFGTITNKKRDGNPLITPYPDWSWNTDPEMCKKQRIVSVYRVWIDECNRLWVIDNGKVGEDQTCPPQLLAFDLKTNKILHQYEIPYEQHINKSLYVTPVAEVGTGPSMCEDTFVYTADVDNFSLLVYDFKNDESWQIFDKTFMPDPNYKTYSLGGETIDLMDGLLGLALSPPANKRRLFYHAMSAESENWVYTKNLKNKSLFSKPNGSPQVFHTFKKGRGTQSSPEAMDKAGNLYFALIGDVEIATWNIREPYDRTHFRIIGNNQETMQWPSGMKVTLDDKGNEILWVFPTAYQKIALNTLDVNQTNFRILSAKISDLKYF